MLNSSQPVHRLLYIDLLRGVAIIGVILAHAGAWPTTYVAPPGIAEKAFLALAASGQLGVQLFFVISAITLCHSADERLPIERAWLPYFIRRVFRIAPMWYLGILAGYLFFLHRLGHPAPQYNATGIASNMLFVQGFFPAYYFDVGPGGWSIATEFIFYAFFPALFTVMATMVGKALQIVLTLFALLMVINMVWVAATGVNADSNGFIYSSFITDAPAFLCGCFVYFRFLKDQRRVNSMITAAVIIAATVATAIWWGGKLPGGHMFKPIGTGVAFSALALLLAQADLKRRWYLMRIGTQSFSIFVIHAFILLLAGEYLVSAGLATRPVAVTVSGLFIFTLLASDLISRVTFRYIEKPMIKLGHRVAGRFAKGSK